MTAIDKLFSKLRSEKRKALMPFITAGDPDLEFTAAVLKEVVGRGSHLCEVGIPYSDPIAAKFAQFAESAAPVALGEKLCPNPGAVVVSAAS